MMTLSIGHLLALGGILFALAMGLSRMVLGVHYPTDVLGGMIIGTLMAAITCILLRKYLKTDLIRKPRAQ